MKNFGIFTLGLSIFACAGCAGSKQVSEPEMDGAAFSEIGEVTAVEETETRKKWKSKRMKKGEEEETIEIAGLDGEEEPELESGRPAAKPGRRSEGLDSASTALQAAKLFIQLGDYDFAGDELRKIGPGSPLYKEAQRLIEQYR